MWQEFLATPLCLTYSAFAARNRAEVAQYHQFVLALSGSVDVKTPGYQIMAFGGCSDFIVRDVLCTGELDAAQMFSLAGHLTFVSGCLVKCTSLMLACALGISLCTSAMEPPELILLP